jgi:hypothetical protein
MQFICLGYFDENRFNALPEGERQSFMKECLAYDQELMERGHHAGGHALDLPSNAVTVRWKNITDGPYTETKEQLGGILVLEARDLNEAIALMSKHPGVKAGGFEIRATVRLTQEGDQVLVSA